MISETAQNNPEACSPQCLEISYFIFITDINTLHKLLLLHPCPLYLPQKQLLTLRPTGQGRESGLFSRNIVLMKEDE